jgi:hypothetical protein
VRTRTNGLACALLALAAAGCGDTASEAPPVDEVAHPAAAPETVEILSADTYRYSGRFLDTAALGKAFADAGRGHTQPIEDPLTIIATASMPMYEVMPAVLAALQPPGRVHLTLRVIENGSGRETTLPVLTACLCRSIHFEDGGIPSPIGHDSSETYVFVTARIDGDGVVRTHLVEHEEPGSLPSADTLPERHAQGAPPLGEVLDLAALGAWFEELQADGIEPLLCLDYRDTLPAGHLVDALTRSKAALGVRVLLGPNPRQVEEEPAEEE